MRNDNRRKPFCGANNDRSSASVASGGKFPTYNVLHGGFWSAGLAGGGTLANKDKSGTSFEALLGAEVGVVDDGGCELGTDRADDGRPDLEPDPEGIESGAKPAFPVLPG